MSGLEGAGLSSIKPVQFMGQAVRKNLASCYGCSIPGILTGYFVG